MSVQHYALKRGDREQFDHTFMDRLKSHRRKGLLDILLQDVKSTQIDGNFGGVFFSVRFRTDKPIDVTSLGFWGPSNGRLCRYDVKVIISQYAKAYPTECSDDLVLCEHRTAIQAQPDAIFQVPLPHPVHIPKKRWISIKFRLDGPPTFTCTESSIKNSYYCPDSAVKFEFHLSSRQLPTINYTLSSSY